MATWLNIPKNKITIEEINDLFDNSPNHFYLKWFDGTKSNKYYEVEIRHGEDIDIKKEFYKELEKRREIKIIKNNMEAQINNEINQEAKKEVPIQNTENISDILNNSLNKALDKFPKNEDVEYYKNNPQEFTELNDVFYKYKDNPQKLVDLKNASEILAVKYYEEDNGILNDKSLNDDIFNKAENIRNEFKDDYKIIAKLIAVDYLLNGNFSPANQFFFKDAVETIANNKNIELNFDSIKINNMEAQTPKTEFNPTDYIKNQIKYLGFGEDEKMHKDLEAGMKGNENQFKIHTTSDKVMKGNKADFTLNFNKTDKGGVFLNSYEAKVTTRNGEERSHTFKVRKENNVTAKEAINLLEGRAVKVALERKNDNGEVSKENVFVKLKLKEEKTEYNNYKFEMYKEKDINIGDIMKKSNIQGDEKQLETVKHH